MRVVFFLVNKLRSNKKKEVFYSLQDENYYQFAWYFLPLSSPLFGAFHFLQIEPWHTKKCSFAIKYAIIHMQIDSYVETLARERLRKNFSLVLFFYLLNPCF